MTAPEVRKAFERWREAKLARCSGCDRGSVLAEAHACIASGLIHATPGETYPLWSSHGRRWYMRERMPGTRVWRLEDDMSFELVSDK